MKYSGDKSLLLPGYDYVCLQIRRLEKRLVDLCKGDDVESVHQGRVACRRLLAGMDFFDEMFCQKKVKLWKKKISKLMKAMGDARDLDVQILFLQDKLAALGEDDGIYRSGLNELLELCRASRRECQPLLLMIAGEVQKSGILKKIKHELKNLVKHCHTDHSGRISDAGVDKLRERVNEKAEQLTMCKDCLENADDSKGHHHMRVQAKKLRYTLELSDVVLDGVLGSFIKKVKRIQAALGVVHDCDIWQGHLTAVIEQGLKKVSEDHRFVYLLTRKMTGYNYLMDELRAERDRAFADVKIFWEELEDEGFWDSLADVFDMLKEKDVEMGYI